jgi:hypothetical protein
VRSIRSQGRLANRELVHSHKAHSRCCNQHQTLNVEIQGTSADHPRHQHLSEGTGCTESCPLPLSYSTPQQHLRIRFLCSRLFHSPDLETYHNQSAPPSYCLHPLPNQSPKPPGNITGIISPGLWAPAYQWSSHPAIPCEAPATRKLKTHPNAACSKNIFISQPLHASTTSSTRRFLDPTKHHIAAHRVTDVAFVSVAFFLIAISEAVTCDLPRQI